ncbi:hypothetical protein GCM10010327_00840 [Streptomyces nitrosporeus]|nr:hypothetical protein GCM10010327_00840 [Streptomyces nitrosporeus]
MASRRCAAESDNPAAARRARTGRPVTRPRSGGRTAPPYRVPGTSTRYVHPPDHLPGRAPRQSVGSNVAWAVSRRAVHSAPSHSLALQLIMIE